MNEQLALNKCLLNETVKKNTLQLSIWSRIVLSELTDVDDVIQVFVILELFLELPSEMQYVLLNTLDSGKYLPFEVGFYLGSSKITQSQDG